MTDFSLDKTGSARLALQDVFRDYGLAGLDDDKLLNQVLPDLLSGAPREAALVQAAGAARVAHLLTERVNASIPAEAATRDVAAILTERTAFDATACLWVVAEYAHAIGHPVDVAPVPSTGGGTGAGGTGAGGAASGGGTGGGEAGGAGTQYTPGRYTPRPPRAEETALDTTGTLPMPPRSNRALLVIAIIAAVVVLGAGTAFAISAWPASKCQGADCNAGPSPSQSRSPSPSTVVSPTPPSPTPTVTVTVDTIVPALNTVMPKDINIASCSTNDNHSYLSGVVSSYACTEGSGSNMPGMKVWGYQFGNQASFEAGIVAFNHFVNFDSGKAGSACPPSSSDSGYTSWHRNDKPDLVLGHIECYSDHTKGHDYVWTDLAEYTIIVTATTPSQSFSKLESWWEANNNNSRDA